MKKIDIARLVIFFIAGIGLYFYMSNAVAAQLREPKLITQMSPEISYALRDAVNAIEDSWYVKDSPTLKLAPLNELKEKNLRRLTQNYPELTPFVNALIVARKRGNWDHFLLYKEKIAELLRPVWHIGAQATMKEAAQKRSIYNRLKNWFISLSQNAHIMMQRIYAYFFPASQPQPSTDKNAIFLQQVLGKTSESAAPEEPATPEEKNKVKK